MAGAQIEGEKVGRRPKTLPPSNLLSGSPEVKVLELLRSTRAELESLAQEAVEPSAVQHVARIRECLIAMESAFKEVMQIELEMLDLVKAVTISGFRSGMHYASRYPEAGAEKAIWDALLRHGEGLLNKTLCDLLAKQGLKIPKHLRSEEREDWWHASERSHNVVQYISRQRMAFRKWAQTEAVYRKWVVPSRKPQ